MNHALLTAAEMAKADQLTIARGISAIQLMENAGQVVASEILKRWNRRSTLVLCGPGNNGGDGFVVARVLHDSGWPVTVAMLGERDRITGSARHHADLWQCEIESIDSRLLDGAELIVDAVFGAGYKIDRINPVTQIMSEIAARQIDMVAIDIPTGVDSDTGNCEGAIAAKLTVTFFRKKPGHLLFPGRAKCGETVVCDIGIEESVLSEIIPTVFENEPSNWLDCMPVPKLDQNKYDRGHALVFGGYPMTGAARLAAISAARIGAGLVTIATSDAAFPIYAAAMTSVMVKPIPGSLQSILADKRISACLIGPGAGVNSETRTHVQEILSANRATVLDADAISVFRDNPELLHNSLHGACVLTPHEGEFSRVFSFYGDKISRAKQAAMQTGSVILLKGPDTVIASPDGRIVINSNAPPTLATAGSGDVLSGIVVGLLAQGMEAFLAACAASWIHGDTANRFGPGLIADDLPGMIPSVIKGFSSFQNAG